MNTCKDCKKWWCIFACDEVNRELARIHMELKQTVEQHTPCNCR